MVNESNPFITYLCSYHVGMENVDKDAKQFRYVMTKEGAKKVVKNRIGTFVIDAETIPGLQAVSNGFTLNVPKIPYTLFNTMVEFFKRVMREKKGAEAMLQFFYNPAEQKYIAYCPQQTVSGASVRFERNEQMEMDNILVAEFHSHNSMNAFFSSVDDADEKRTMIFGVLGKLDKPVFQYKVRMSVSGDYMPIELGDIFEMPASQDCNIDNWVSRCVNAQTPAANYGYGYDNDGWEDYYSKEEVKKLNNLRGYYSSTKDVMKDIPDDDYDEFDTNTSIVKWRRQRNAKSNNTFVEEVEVDDDEDAASVLPIDFDVNALDDFDVECLLKEIVYNKFEDLVAMLISENLLDEVQNEALRQFK